MTYLDQAWDLFYKWQEEENYSTRMLNFLVRQLTECPNWTDMYISKVDREDLIKLAKYLENK